MGLSSFAAPSLLNYLNLLLRNESSKCFSYLEDIDHLAYMYSLAFLLALGQLNNDAAKEKSPLLGIDEANWCD